jgi:hypothetical protein
MICAACGFSRDPHDLLAFWPVGSSDRRRFVCRPTRPASESMPSCFARAVGTRDIHAIALVTDPRPVLRELTRIRPNTDAWDGLLRECGVRAA